MALDRKSRWAPAGGIGPSSGHQLSLPSLGVEPQPDSSSGDSWRQLVACGPPTLSKVFTVWEVRRLVLMGSGWGLGGQRT